jgi:hypothetical protein
MQKKSPLIFAQVYGFYLSGLIPFTGHSCPCPAGPDIILTDLNITLLYRFHHRVLQNDETDILNALHAVLESYELYVQL